LKLQRYFPKKDVETNKELLDLILDKAGAKGTGKWTSQDAMDRGVSIPTIDIAVSLRTLSAYKEDKELMHQKFILKHILLRN
jgi:6-phosphogluconate dehydrogenase